ncbi:MAG: deoxyribose-phosphate aldolase [Candidatus Omnitrophica bacterium]|nr:deoxyribose-phosphate aldolase [Candidatus Omnitrophota bacterium]
MTLREIARLIDHALLHPAMTDDEIVRGCELARQYEVKAVCVKPYAIPVAKEILKNCPVAICAVVGFPHGSSSAGAKLRECQDALSAGANEIDVVINIGKAISGAYDYVKEELRPLNRVCARTASPLKVIFENDFLNDAQIIELCKVCNDVNVAFVKTSTGFGFVKQPGGDYNYKGATEHQVRLMRQHTALHIGIKASGGIRTLDDVLKFKALGCMRFGTSATFGILEEAKKRGYV